MASMNLPNGLTLYRLSESDEHMHPALRKGKRKLKNWNTGDIAYDKSAKCVKSVLEHGCREGFSTWSTIEKCISALYDGRPAATGELWVYVWALLEKTKLAEGLVPKRDERNNKDGHFALGAANRESYETFLPRLDNNWTLIEARRLSWKADKSVVVEETILIT